jgi:hypothetical protein
MRIKIILPPPLNLVAVMLLALAIPVIISCGQLENDYEEFVLNNGIVHLSFEYPTSYDEPYADPYGDSEANHVIINFVPAKAKLASISIDIGIYKTTEEFSDARSMLEYYQPDYKLLDQ